MLLPRRSVVACILALSFSISSFAQAASPAKQKQTAKPAAKASATKATAKTAAADPNAAVAKRLDQVVLDEVNAKAFMGAVLVAKGNDVLLSKGYGSANLEWNIPNSPTTKFRLGSLTKQFTAASILLLEERGKLALTDPVKKYITDAPAAWDAITLHHLLSHSSGIPNLTNTQQFPDYNATMSLKTTPAQLIARFRDKPLDFPAGERFNYSNSGYIVLGVVIEKVSGQTYEQFVQDNLFTPLGMKDTGYDSAEKVIPQRASGYEPAPAGAAATAPASTSAGTAAASAGAAASAATSATASASGNGSKQGASPSVHDAFVHPEFIHPQFIHMTIPFSAGGLYSTTEDLLKWEQALMGGKLLKAESFTKMTTANKGGYGYGVSVRPLPMSKGPVKAIGHGGGIEGFNTSLSYFPDEKVTVIVLGNVAGSAPGTIAKNLALVAHGETIKLASERIVPVATKVLAEYVGTYRFAPEFAMVITLEGDQLMTQATGQGKAPIYPESETRFFPKIVDATIEFVRDANGKVTGLVLHQGGREMKAARE